MISSNALHRMESGQILYGLNHYNLLDFEIPLLSSFKEIPKKFDDVINLDPKN